MLQRYYK